MDSPRWFRRILRVPLSASRQAARDVDQELRLHLDLRTEELMASGMSEEEARREAERAFGNLERARNELLSSERRRIRSVRTREWIGDLARDLRYAARSLARAPGFTVLAVVTLTLGIGANTALFSVVDAVLLAPLPVRAPEELAMIWEAHERERPADRNVVSPANYVDWRERSRAFRSMAGFFESPGTVFAGGEPREVTAQLVHPDFFRVLGVEPILGRSFTPKEAVGPPGRADAAVLSHPFWRDHFGSDPDVVGRRLELADRRAEIVGVMGRELAFLSPDVAFWMPTDFAWADRENMGRFIRVIGRLAPGATHEAAAREMATIAADLRREHPDFNARWSTNVVPLNEQVKGDIRPALLVLLASVGVLLLVACMNVANLLMVRAASRRTEIAVRASLGAGRGRIVRGLIAEGLLLSLLGGACGVGLAHGVTRLLVVSVPEGLRVPRLEEASVHLGVLVFAAVLALLCGFLFGPAAALEAFRTELAGALREGERGGGAGGPVRRVRALMVVGEIAFSLLLLTAAGLLLRSFVELQRTDLGMRVDGVLTGRITLRGERYESEGARAAFFDRALDSIAALPQVRAVGAVSWLPLGNGLSATGYYLPDRPRPPSGEMPVTQVQAVQGDFFRAMGIPLLQGRGFDARDGASGPEVVIVNRAFAEQTWPGEDPLGKRFVLPWGRDRNLEVVGVVGNVRQEGVATAPQPGIYLPYPQFPAFPFATLVIRTAEDDAAIARQVVARIHEIDPSLAVADVLPMRAVVADAIARPRLTSLLVSSFAGLAFLLAAVGIYGVVSYSVTLRWREMGVRRALGARAGDLARLVLGDAFRLGAIGVGVGMVGALLATRVLRSLLYGVSPTDPLTLAGTACFLLVVALLAGFVPALRAARVDPTQAMREP